MRVLTSAEANSYLGKVGLRVGQWNELQGGDEVSLDSSSWISLRAPSNARELFCFSHHVAGWLPKGLWKIFQIDNSTSLSADEEFAVFRLLYGDEPLDRRPDARTFLFQFGRSSELDKGFEFLIANLIHLFLLFEAHGYLASSGCANGQRLAIQDGFVYFIFGEASRSNAEALIRAFQAQPLSLPGWAIADDA